MESGVKTEGIEKEMKDHPMDVNKSRSGTPKVDLSEITETKNKSSSSTPNPTKRKAQDIQPIEFEEPIHEYIGGSSIRRYLNEHITEHLMQGLKKVGTERPEEPLKWLGHYLIEKSKETEKLT